MNVKKHLQQQPYRTTSLYDLFYAQLPKQLVAQKVPLTSNQVAQLAKRRAE